jgi:hypothetical protein
MKRFINLMSVVLVLSVVATASDLGGNPEVSIQKVNLNNPTTVYGGGNHCDSIERLLGMCRSSQDFLQEN